MRQRLTRREALYFVGAAALSAARTSAQEAALEFDGIDHVEFYVSQVQRTRDFLAAVFGPTVLVNATAAKNYVKVGSGYFAFERPRTEGGPLTTDHVSMAIRNIEMPRVHALLDAKGIAYRDYPERPRHRDPRRGRHPHAALAAERLEPAEAPEFPARCGGPERGTRVSCNRHRARPAERHRSGRGGPVLREGLRCRITALERSHLVSGGPLATWTCRKRRRCSTPACITSALLPSRSTTTWSLRAFVRWARPSSAPRSQGAPSFRDPDGLLVQVSGAP